jgi:hypothetical protein
LAISAGNRSGLFAIRTVASFPPSGVIRTNIDHPQHPTAGTHEERRLRPFIASGSR